MLSYITHVFSENTDTYAAGIKWKKIIAAEKLTFNQFASKQVYVQVKIRLTSWLLKVQ